MKKIRLKNPIDVATMIEAAAKEGAEMTPAELVELLNSRAPMLNEYFSLEMEEGKLVAVPQILDNYVPPMHRIPELLYGVAESLVLQTEVECLQNVGIEIALFNSTCQEWEIIERDLVYDESQEDESAKSSGAHGYSKQRLSWTIQHIIFPALRLMFLPPTEFTEDGSVMEIASLSELYQSFERC
jgi:DNA mismatch repair protein MLH1